MSPPAKKSKTADEITSDDTEEEQDVVFAVSKTCFHYLSDHFIRISKCQLKTIPVLTVKGREILDCYKTP